MKPFFSVIVCTYNCAHLLARALESLMAQSESDWEAIVVDDGSTDHTSEVVSKFTSFDTSVRLFKLAHNRGLSAARNVGIRISRGRFVTFLDSDDEYAVDHLSIRKAMLWEEGACRFLHGGVKVIGNPYVVDKNDPTKTIHIRKCALGGTFVIRRNVFKEIGGFAEMSYAEDADFYERVVAAGIKTKRSDDPSYLYYRNVAGQLTSRYAAAQLKTESDWLVNGKKTNQFS